MSLFIFFLHSIKHKLNLYVVTASAFDVGWYAKARQFTPPTPPTQSNGKTQFIANFSVAVLQSVCIMCSINMANCLLEAKIVRTTPHPPTLP